MTLNAKIGSFMDFLAISGCDTRVRVRIRASFTRCRHETIVMRSR